MKRFLIKIFIALIAMSSIVNAESFDTNVINFKYASATPGFKKDLSVYNPYWYFLRQTGTRYVFRIYDWNTDKYISVPPEYYINHIYSTKYGKEEVMYLGVSKNEADKYDAVKRGTPIFTDKTYSHVLKWFDNSAEVKKFGLSKKDVKLLAEIVRDAANKNGNIALANSMQNVIDGKVPYDIRAEILFHVKMPGTTGAKRNVTVQGKGAIDTYTFTAFDNKGKTESTWRKEYLTYLEIKYYSYKRDNDGHLNNLRDTSLDQIACALYEKDYDYVFENGVYQCSCDLYKLKYPNTNLYTVENKALHVHAPLNDPKNSSKNFWSYCFPGRCGIPVTINNIKYYVSAGITYPNVNGAKLHVSEKVFFSDKGVKYPYDSTYRNIVTTNPNVPIIYEGWDYITNNMAALSIVGCDKGTGSIISLNGKTYSEFENLSNGTYTKEAWNIEGYTYLGYIVKDDFTIPNAPLGIADTQTYVEVTLNTINNPRKQIIFVYEKNKSLNKSETKLSIYKIGDTYKDTMYVGNYDVDLDNNLDIEIYNKSGLKYSQKIKYDESKGYIIDVSELEETLEIRDYEYIGGLVKKNPDYFLNYQGEELIIKEKQIYNISDTKQDKVHVILGYKTDEVKPQILPDEKPKLKISYLDEDGNPITNKQSTETTENIGVDITSKAEDFRSDNYMYLGYTYVDSYNDFANIATPIQILGKQDNIVTNFYEGSARRHIAFVYKKIELKFDIDIHMQVDDLNNQLISQKEDEDYWVLDEEGKVTLNLKVSNNDGLNITSFGVKLRIPFDTYMNNNYVQANTINNLNANILPNILVADKLRIPVWVNEGKYNIDAVIEANVEGFGIYTANAKDDVEVVGRLYDFTIIGLDSSDITGDQIWSKALFDNEEEYRANVLPIGQANDSIEKYNYGIKLGTNFYYNINTKGQKNSAISIYPRFLYVSKDGKILKEVDVYANHEGKLINISNQNAIRNYMSLRDSNISKSNLINEIERALLINKISNRYNYQYTSTNNIGNLSNTIVGQKLSLPDLKYIDEFINIYGLNNFNTMPMEENALLTFANHWYGKYVVPASSIVVDKGASISSAKYKDGYLIVLFKIVSLDENLEEYLDYNLPKTNTQWQKENLNQMIKLPITNNQIMLDTLRNGYAPVIIYDLNITTKDNVTSVGTH